MQILLVLILLLALAGAYWLRRRGQADASAAGLPARAQVVYSDTGAWERPAKPFFASQYRLTGKPDYIVRDESGSMIPIEVKPNRTGEQPRYADVMQLMAYGVLLENEYGELPGYGLLKYRDRVFRVELSSDLRAELLATMNAMRRARGAENVARSHADTVRCRYCGYREACAERLE